MSLFTWDHFEKDNELLRKRFPTGPLQLTIRSGFFLAPDDNGNRRSPLPKALIGESIVDLFHEQFPAIYDDVLVFYALAGGFDRLDYKKFKSGAKLAYFFAATQYTLENRLPLAKLSDVYKEPHVSAITQNMRNLLVTFIRQTAQDSPRHVFGLFASALKSLQTVNPKMAPVTETASVADFIAAPNYNPFGNIIGSAFEQVIQTRLEESSKESLLPFIQDKAGEPGVLIAFDTDTAFKAYAQKNAKGLSVPDYLFVSQHQIIPIDLKVNLDFAKEQQVSAENLKLLFEKCAPKMAIIFRGAQVV